MKYDIAAFIMRGQPLHNGHISVIKQALDQAETVLVFIGGATGARRPRNPWTFSERADMVRCAFPLTESHRIKCIALPDFTYNDAAWTAHVQSEVAAHKKTWRADATKVALIGRRKDNSGYYLNLFPQWDSIAADVMYDIDATTIRTRLFEKGEIPGPDLVPASTTDFLTSYLNSVDGALMVMEWAFIKKYKKVHDSGAYHRNNVTADAIVVQGAHLLVVRRKSYPGKGMLALPGGHVDKDELPRDAAVRELREETGIKIPMPALFGAIETHRVFDNPYRSDLARTYTFAYLFRLKNEGAKLAKLKAGSDAESAFWLPLNEMREYQMFDDHYHIVKSLLGIG